MPPTAGMGLSAFKQHQRNIILQQYNFMEKNYGSIINIIFYYWVMHFVSSILGVWETVSNLEKTLHNSF